MFSTVLFILTLAKTTTTEQEGVYFQIEDNSFLLDENPIAEETADSLVRCSQKCSRERFCRSANFWIKEGKCTLLKNTRRYYPHKMLKQAGSVHLEKQLVSEENALTLGSTQISAVTSCQTLCSLSPVPSSGIYWIDPDGGSHANAFQAYCDMDTDGGGWTLVWSYTFTKYGSFTNNQNAITPRPDWPVTSPKVDVQISTVPPRNETDYNALNFSAWKQLGNEVLIKSNINNWLTCTPNTGSLVDWREGLVTCKIVHHVTNTCKGTVPSSFSPNQGFGPMFYISGYWSGTFYYFDGSTTKHWPTHDPCGKNRANNLQNVQNPHGNIFIR